MPVMPGAEARTKPPQFGPKWRARSVTDPAFASACENVAKQIQRHIGGEIKTIRPVDPLARLGSYREYTPGDRGWAYHEVVVKGGRVYDAFTGHQGLAIEEYKALWEYHDAIDFGF